MNLKRYLINNILTEIFFSRHLIDGKYMFHYTHVDNIENIMREGLLKSKNEAYPDGCDGVHFTLKRFPDDANLSAHLWQEYQDSYYDDEIDYTVIARLTVDISNLNEALFDVDDDHKMLVKNSDVEDSLRITASLCYLDNVDKKYIEKIEYYVDYHTYEDVTKIYK